MADNIENNPTNLDFYKKKNKEEMKYQVVTFALMIFFTLVAFSMVAFGDFGTQFVIPVILLLAGVQVAFQLYYFMHMSHKGHGMPALMLWSGVFVAVLTIAAMVTIVWW